jgi:predicted  nucleic acid-binding Zn-ribbon protein
MSNTVTDEQLQAITEEWSRDIQLHQEIPLGIEDPATCVAILLQAIRERDSTIAGLRNDALSYKLQRDQAQEMLAQRDATIAELETECAALSQEDGKLEREVERLQAQIAELHKPADDGLVSNLSGFLTVMASYPHITVDQSDKMRSAASQMLAMQRELEQLRPFKVALNGIPEIAITHGGWNVQAYTDALKAELRKPVAVEADTEIEAIRVYLRTHPQLDGADGHYLIAAYDTLAQKAASDASARDALMAEIRGLRERLEAAKSETESVDRTAGRMLEIRNAKIADIEQELSSIKRTLEARTLALQLVRAEYRSQEGSCTKPDPGTVRCYVENSLDGCPEQWRVPNEVFDLQVALSDIQQRERQLREALESLVDIIDKAGLLNLSNGVQLGQTSWYVKASDRLEFARAALAQPQVSNQCSNDAREVAEVLFRFRDHVQRFASQWREGGGSHHHPIWLQVATALEPYSDPSGENVAEPDGERPQGEQQFEGCDECVSPWPDAHAGDCRIATGMKTKESGNEAHAPTSVDYDNDCAPD